MKKMSTLSIAETQVYTETYSVYIEKQCSISDELINDGNLKSMGVKNVVNIPSENVGSALGLSPEDFKVNKHVTLQHQRCNVESVFSSVEMTLLFGLITNTVLHGNLFGGGCRL